MNVNELMVGDWVNYRGIYNKIAPADFCHFEWIDEIRPIPLTLEILEKNGFEITEFDNRIYDTYMENNIRLGIQVEPWQFWCYYNQLTPEGEINDEIFRILFQETPYVHQLQHVLRLCGIEKEIEL